MTDDKLRRDSIDVVAKHLIARLVEWHLDQDESWEDYPDIGQHDWDAVMDRAVKLTESARPHPDRYGQAYAYLSSLAGEA